VLERKPPVLEAGAKAHSFPVRNVLVFGRKTAAYHTFQSGESLILLQIGLFW
jgi:hypothetical protein